jgi:GNAT superfamily N-acetyltransferase
VIAPRKIARAAHSAARARLLAYAAAAGTDVLRGENWTAVRTGVNSNDMNGVVSEDGVKITPELVQTLTSWFASAGMPASWLTSRALATWSDVLLAGGGRAERSGNWAGRPITGSAAGQPWEGTIVRVESRDYLERWLDVAAACGWIVDDGDRGARQRLCFALGLEHPQLSHWLAMRDTEAVGFASAFVHGSVVDLCNLGVLESHRRQGIGRALVAARLHHATMSGATLAVSAPSPDGWLLQRSLGFGSAPVIADTCFYLATGSEDHRLS